MTLLEPSYSDETVSDATVLLHRLEALPETQPLSLHLIGHLRLGVLPLWRHADRQTLLNITFGKVLTLWSNSGAILDAEGAGRIFTVLDGAKLLLQGVHVTGGRTSGFSGGCAWAQDRESQLIVRDSRFTNCTVVGGQGGGALWLSGAGNFAVLDSEFEDCEASRPGIVTGGGIGMTINARLTIRNTRFVRTRAVSSFNNAMGGGISVYSGALNMHNVTFVNTSVSAESDGAYGAGLGVFGGVVQAYSCTWIGTRAEGRRAWGGGLGMRNGGSVNLFDSTMMGCSAIAPTRDSFESTFFGVGGAVGTNGGGVAHLVNVSLIESIASHPEHGLVLYAEPESVDAAILNIRQECSPSRPLVAGDPRPANETVTRLIGVSFLQRTAPTEGRLLLRNLSIDAATCPLPPLVAGTTLIQCGATFDREWPLDQHNDVCGANAVCTTTAHALIPTPLCECQPSSLHLPLVQPVPSPAALRPELAPYTTQGCVEAPVQLAELNRNWWRASRNTTQIHACVDFWQPGEPTPCAGGRDPSSYCEPNRGLIGPRCRVCVDGEHYFDETIAKCVRCPLTGGAALMPSLVILVAVGGVLCLPYATWRRQRRWLKDRHSRLVALLEHVAAIFPRLGLVGKAKIVFGYFQVRTMPTISQSQPCSHLNPALVHGHGPHRASER